MKKFMRFIKSGKKSQEQSTYKTTQSHKDNESTKASHIGGATALPEEVMPVYTMTDTDVYRNMEAARAILCQPGDLSERNLFDLREKILLLTESGHESSIYTHYGLSLLCDCIIYNKMDALVLLIDLGVNVNSSSSETESRNLPLHIACSFGKLEYVSFLLEQGAYPSSKCEMTINPDGTSRKFESEKYDAFGFALENDNVDVLQILLKYPSSRSDASSFLLHSACRVGSTKCVKLILREFPEQLNTTDNEGRTALWYAFWKEPTLAMMIAEKSPNILKEITPEKSYNMLLKVCSAAHLGLYERGDAVRFLLKYGDSSMLSRVDDDGNTPLHHLCLLCGRSCFHFNGPYQSQDDYDRNLLTSIRLLVEAGSDPNARNTVGYPPIMELLTNKRERKMYEQYFKTNFLKTTYSCISRAMVVLLDCGVSLSIDQYTHPLTKLANTAGHLEPSSLHSAHPYIKDMICALLDKGTSPDIKTCMGWPVLLSFLNAYLSRDSKYSHMDLANDYCEIMDIFITNNVSFPECSLRTNLYKRESNFCKEFIYIMMQEIRYTRTVRIPVIRCFDKMLDVIKKQNKYINMSNPEIPQRKTLCDVTERSIDYKGSMDFPSFCLYIYTKDSANAELLTLLLKKLCQVVEKKDTDFKDSILQAAKRQNLSSKIQDQLERALLTF